MSWLFVTVIALNDVIRYVVVCFFQTTFFCVADSAMTGGARSPSTPAGFVWVCFFMQR